MRKWLTGVALVLCLIPSRATAQDSSQSEVRALDALLNTPVSTAAKYAQGVRQVAGSVTIVTAEDIRRFGYRSLEEVLQGAAGFYLTYNRQYTYVGVRGFGRSNDHNNRILLLLDGHTVNEGLEGSSQIGASMVLDLSMVKRIEILRGPASALYGTGALLAVVNVITESDESAQVQARAGVGADGYHEASVTAGTHLGAAHLEVSGTWDQRDGKDLFYPEFDTPATNNGIARGLDWAERSGFYATVRMGSFSLRGRYGRSAKGLPTGAYGSAFNNPGTETTDESGFAELMYEHDLSDNKHLSVRTFVDAFAVTGRVFTGAPTQLLGHNQVIGGEAAFRWEPVASSRLTLGVEYRNNTTARLQLKLPGFGLTLIDQPFSVVSLYAQEDWQVTPKLSILAGFRHDMNSVTSSATTPRIAAIYDPWKGTTLKAMYGQAFRAATPLEDGTRLTGATGHLSPERLQMAELIWIQRLTEGLALTSSVYQYRVDHLIDEVADSLQPLAYDNRGRVQARGVEVVLDLRPSPDTRGYLSFSEQRAVDEQGANKGQVLNNSPEQLLKAGFSTNLGPRISAGAQLAGESSRLTRNGNKTDAVLLADMNLLFRPFSFFEVGLRVANLFDTRYAHPAGVELRQDTIEQDGRMWSLYVTSRF
ncbi:MAG TPA: TonB-dependent receptor [Gemmatimonadales bacterium]|nr:TonB-dependent receptor [Gemmatimonadales bacterium]